MSWRVSPWLILYGTLNLLDLIDYFLFHVGDILNYNVFKNFLIPFPFPFFFLDPYNSKVGVFDIVLEISETVLSSFHSVYFILLFRSYFQHFIFQLTNSFFCFRYVAIDSFQSVFNFSNCVVCLCKFFFNSSRSLLIDSCIFFILFSRFLIIFTYYSEFFFRSFPYFLFIYLDLCVSSLFLHLSSISLPFHIFLKLLCLRSPFPRLQG